MREILIYGKGDPTVAAALLRLARQVENVAPSEDDRDVARALQRDLTRDRD